ncbi:MAG: dihydrodipicolinate synthase family protein [Planctomycetota bacterium]
MHEALFSGVLPAITTPFTESGEVDCARLASHCRVLLEAGCAGLIPLGSLGEGATLEYQEKILILRTLVKAAGEAPVIAGVAGTSTQAAMRLAKAARDEGCAGLMVLPSMLYPGSRAEALAHARAVLGATDLPCMLYNNPAAYGTDFTCSMVSELAKTSENLVAVKESSGDSRRVTAIRCALGERLAVCVGLDDMVVEGHDAGARGWVAGLVNALPEESVRLFRLLEERRREEALALYRWFLPLLRLDTGSDFVQWIKLVQQECGGGEDRVRSPRLRFEGREREEALALIRDVMSRRPQGAS